MIVLPNDSKNVNDVFLRGKEPSPEKKMADPSIEQDADDQKKDIYLYRPGRIPPYRQMFYQVSVTYFWCVSNP